MAKKQDINSKELQDAIKVLTDSLLDIIGCQKDLGEYRNVMNEYAISILQNLLKIGQIPYKDCL